MRMGIDVGGTFTDFVYISNSGQIKYSKVLTTYPPEKGIRNGLGELGVSLRDFDFISHSTTLGLNALVTRKGAKTALITTEGFRDSLEIGRTRRLSLYDLFQDKPEEQLVPRHLRFEVTERLDKNGSVLKKIDPLQVLRVVRKVKAAHPRAVAVSLIHS
ncbi:MAG: hydantoinase/oxoprolinase family protein, partial [Thaumarchaeota archaeon]|nr:hydantoinase/oxoprolinase family protein [Nitrososphaerota archaeon]